MRKCMVLAASQGQQLPAELFVLAQQAQMLAGNLARRCSE